ncbi:16S rRNA (cytosine(1402)-N(4))-methyltransferase RsmH [Parasaccharibacter sp. TMW2.1882]|nr:MULTISPECIES: 16S rRNA (cytosine(1402)-N(4))-methyltransferase RsmH [Acetobacteraceae]MUG79637.1 16S rRNA (cytosine(1402)-N(4))-methyltransferase RsmH [Bombella sp. ESL0380]QGT75950.1 16S rRNA (cytosine(1402)-N(4))-methyltransferase RsmH [Bombella sp. ESL0368]MCK8636928.1 16S rRNA (cytosine(1402)-N(4))-methyltransferase RsmH [Parasaccharibacter sp. TMW2.1885]MCL1495960.1 16S rRNA (cytosine(1402)-N(4))-methyltransferase RsmH [Parasaccharibacter sp. TMW2.1882]MCL1511532.1 16S rRNA (cytosine(1
MQREGHFPVMLPEVLDTLAPQDGGVYLDGTFGGGGYSRALLRSASCTVHAIDRDPDAIKRGQPLVAASEGRLHLHQGTFSAMKELAGHHGPFNGIVLDLGVSSFQLDQEERGFSFRHDGPLDMRMSTDGLSAADIVNGEKEQALADILYHYGEERRSRRVARAIIEARQSGPIQTTGQLADIIRKAVPKERPNFDPATRSFQAIRIAVNDELGELERTLETAPGLLAPGGIFCIVTFHSLEDRMTKRALARLAGRMAGPSRHTPLAMQQTEAPSFELLHTRPRTPSDQELNLNPRSRSARLRALRRLPAHGASA